MLFPVFLYLFLASSHQLYAKLWLDSFSFVGPLGGVDTSLTVLRTQMGDIHLRILFYIIIGTVLRGHCLGAYLHFLYLRHLLYHPLLVVRPTKADILY